MVRSERWGEAQAHAELLVEGSDPSPRSEPSLAQPAGFFLRNVTAKPRLQTAEWIKSTGVMPLPVHRVNTA